MNNQIIEVLESNQLEQSKSEYILNSFTTFFEQAKEWETKAKAIQVTDISQTDKMREARETRLALKDIRVNAEKARVKLKEQSLREGKAVDGIANVIKALIIPMEEYLETQEKYAEIIEEERKNKVETDRVDKLSRYVENTSVYNLRDISDADFEGILQTAQVAYEARQKELELIEEARIAKEKAEAEERERIKLENEALKKEAEAREKAIAEERAKAELERKKLEQQQQKEREAREKAEAELKAKKEAEEKEKKAEAEKIVAEKKAKADAEKKARLAPDKEKLALYADTIKSLPAPKDVSPEALLIVSMIEKKLLELSQLIAEQIKTL